MATATAPPPEKAKGRKRPTKAQEETPAQATTPQTPAEWIPVIEALPPEDKNEKYPDMTNAQVLAVLRYQVTRKGAKATDSLTAGQGRLLRDAAKVYPAALDRLSAPEKEAVVAWTDDELDDEQKARVAQKPALKGKARYLWVVFAKDGRTAIAEGRAKAAREQSSEEAPKRQRVRTTSSGSLPRAIHPELGRWHEGAWEKMAPTNEGCVCFVLTEPDGAAVMLGHFPDENFHDLARAAMKKRGIDPESAYLLTCRARFAWANRPVDADRFHPAWEGKLGKAAPAAA